MKEIQLTNSTKVAIVDDEDAYEVEKYEWFVIKDRNILYAARQVSANRVQRLHNFVLNIKFIDHKDGDGLNNRKSNLRKATTRQNGQNRGKFKATSSRYKGVSWHTRDKKWTARIKVNDKRIQLGYFLTEKDAANAYNAAALKFFGEFARINTL